MIGTGKKGHRGLPLGEALSEEFHKRWRVGNLEAQGGGEGSREWPWLWGMVTEKAMGKGH